MKPRQRHLQDVAKMCPAVFDVPGPIMQCQLPPDHEGLHKHDCTRWGDAHNRRPSQTSSERSA